MERSHTAHTSEYTAQVERSHTAHTSEYTAQAERPHTAHTSEYTAQVEHSHTAADGHNGVGIAGVDPRLQLAKPAKTPVKYKYKL